MSRRIFLHSNSFHAASNIFTKIIWKKEKPAIYQKIVELVYGNTRLFYTMAIHHSAITNSQNALASEKILILTTELEEVVNESKNRTRAVYRYKITSSAETGREKILEEEVTVYKVSAQLTEKTGDLHLPGELGDNLEFTVKKGLSATITGCKEIYLPYHETRSEEDF